MISSIGSMNNSIMDDMRLNNGKNDRIRGERSNPLNNIGIGKKPESDEDYQMIIDKLSQARETNQVAENIFNKLDENQDGQLTLDEVKNGKPANGRPEMSGPPPMPGTGGMDRAMFEFRQSSEAGQAGPPPPQSGGSESASGISTDESSTYDADDLNQDGIVDMTEMLQAIMKEKQANAARSYDNYSLLAS